MVGVAIPAKHGGGRCALWRGGRRGRRRLRRGETFFYYYFSWRKSVIGKVGEQGNEWERDRQRTTRWVERETDSRTDSLRGGGLSKRDNRTSRQRCIKIQLELTVARVALEKKKTRRTTTTKATVSERLSWYPVCILLDGERVWRARPVIICVGVLPHACGGDTSACTPATPLVVLTPRT